jgi:hypothetical protein
MRFATREAADAHRAHRGDRSKIVPLTIRLNDYHRMFSSRHSDVADLRQLTHILIVGS